MAAASGRAAEDPFDHCALHYVGDQEYLEGTVPFIDAALAAGDPVAVAVPGPSLRLLRGALGDAVQHVQMLDMAEVGANPGCIITKVLRDFADRHAGRRVHLIEEPTWPARTAAEYPACALHEALVNLAFTGRDAAILCPYDCAGLQAQWIADSQATHPMLVDRAGRRPSRSYDPDRVIADSNRPLDPRPWTAIERQVDRDTIDNARWFATSYGRSAGLGSLQLVDLEIAVTELATLCVLYGGGAGTIRLWSDKKQLLCEVEGIGPLTDPLAGHRPFTEDHAQGRSLLMVHHVVDLLRTYTGPCGTTARFHLRLP
ncbi:sensor histidine kinase [Glycomyces terrestris]|uniref:sensor histidine kinase n=1 Tax=Glycomyces terrestris TaxID=2493553 RepID=UPI0018D56D22|nr:sensor histidine kinase [Glycomyces terrestris]